MNKQRYKRRFRICLTIKHQIDWHSDRVGVCTGLWNYVWIHHAGLLGYFERKLLSGGVFVCSEDAAIAVNETRCGDKIYLYWNMPQRLRRTRLPMTCSCPLHQSIMHNIDAFLCLVKDSCNSFDIICIWYIYIYSLLVRVEEYFLFLS